ncbi:MAG TPA: enoyl-CoA hydratase/isomerase family protein [Thermoanaerobaculia bacterium]|jgi:enoyl-CoA hydratase|nr:enoyl-CoA hydratase/isomerase family protein [Thermoanaerobaculia bacterium]
MIERRDEGPVTILELRHKKANALDVELLGALEDELAAAERAGQAIVLTGTGSIFSAGVDLYRVLDGGTAYLDSFLPALDSTLRRLFTFPRPAVAAINGHAMAGGWILACSCDYRVASLAAGKLGLPELHVGVAFPPIAVETVRFATPVSQLNVLMLAGRTYSGEEAARHGLVDEAVPAEAVLARAVAVATGQASIPANAYGLTKQQLRAPTMERVEAATATAAAVRAQWASGDAVASIRAYMDRVVGKGR